MNTTRSRLSVSRRQVIGSRPSSMRIVADAKVPAITCLGTACVRAIMSRSAHRWIVSAAEAWFAAGGVGLTKQPGGAVTVSGAHIPAFGMTSGASAALSA